MINLAPFPTPTPGIQLDAGQALRRILSASPQDLWLETMRRTKIGVHDDLIHWMLSQIQCDFAVAALAFYRADPTRHLDDPKPLPARPGVQEIFAQVLLHWDLGFYRQHRLSLRDRDCDPRLLRRINQKLKGWPRGALPFTIPTQLLDPTGGKAQTLPAHLSPDRAAHLWHLFDQLGLQLHSKRPERRGQMRRAKQIIRKVAFQTRRA